MPQEKEIVSARPFFDDESIRGILYDVQKILESGLVTDGPYLRKFEEMFANYVGTKEAIAVNSGTCSLEIMLRHFDIRGKEVIVPTNTFIASPNTVLYAGGRPILADIKEETLCIDPEDAQKRITSKTAGIMVVHIAGLVCPEMRQLKEICQDHHIFLIEDAAHAHGAMIDGKKAGSLCDGGSFSFFPTKVMTTCEGGMITTNDENLARRARILRNHGINKLLGEAVALGYNWRMSELDAAIGIYQLMRLDSFIDKRQMIAKKYDEGVQQIKGVKAISAPSNIRHSYYKYPLRVDAEIDPAKLADFLKTEYKVNTGNIYYPPCHLHALYKEMFGYKGGELPVSERILKRVIALPMHVQLSDADVYRVLEGLAKGVELLTGGSI